MDGRAPSHAILHEASVCFAKGPVHGHVEGSLSFLQDSVQDSLPHCSTSRMLGGSSRCPPAAKNWFRVCPGEGPAANASG